MLIREKTAGLWHDRRFRPTLSRLPLACLRHLLPPQAERAGKIGQLPISPDAVMSLIPEIKPQQSIELLKELHILTRDGKINQDTRRKLKQVYHLYQFIEPLLQDVLNDKGELTLADHGA
ncbi:hypothetical protein [Paludibacterium denitrificans]|uniref:hypothetical protein n=1 Tax=Paludibacterium denitrificans TaxID=2675226 RepID=UPI001E617205|nr:hypothetical protein [Paludibacterium denitrificans]